MFMSESVSVLILCFKVYRDFVFVNIKEKYISEVRLRLRPLGSRQLRGITNGMVTSNRELQRVARKIRIQF